MSAWRWLGFRIGTERPIGSGCGITSIIVGSKVIPRVPSLVPFLDKLAAKRQSVEQREQAALAVGVLLAPCRDAEGLPESGEEPMKAEETFRCREGDQGTDAEGGWGASWETEFRELEGVIKMRNYSGKTLDAYRKWARKFQAIGARGREGVSDGPGCASGRRGIHPEPGLQCAVVLFSSCVGPGGTEMAIEAASLALHAPAASLQLPHQIQIFKQLPPPSLPDSGRFVW